MKTKNQSAKSIIGGDFESVYDSAGRDLQSEGSQRKTGSTVKIFSYKEFNIELKEPTWKQRWQKGWKKFKETKNPLAGALRGFGIKCSDTLTLRQRIKRGWNAMKETPQFAGDIFAEINKKMNALGWRMGSLGDMLAYEAMPDNQHEYPLFAIGRFYEHTVNRGPMANIGDKIVPVITKNGSKRLEQYDLYSEPFAENKEKGLAQLLPDGYFIAIR